MKFYKVTLNGSCQGQDIRNILYYREGAGLTWTNPFYFGAERLVTSVNDEVVTPLLAFMPNDYTLDSIDVLPHDDAFIPTVSAPHSVVINRAGINAGVHAGMTQVCNFKFVLEPTGLQNGIWPPKKGYVALGPIVAAWVGEDGFIPAATLSTPVFTDVENALSKDLLFIDPTPGSFYPIRVRRNSNLLGMVKWSSWADVSACYAQRRVSNRRSRMPEA